jgi:tRNA modification GTPase
LKTKGDTTTICAIATASGGAIGIVRVSGPKSIPIVDCIYKGKSRLKEALPYSVNYGVIKDEGEILDQVLVMVFRAPASYTGEDSVEISCHGSSFILKSIISLLIKNGCEPAAPGEYTMRAFVNGKMDLCQAEAVADLIAANNKAAHQIAFSQMRGSVSNKLAALREQLLQLSSLLELELDFSEEDVEFADRHKLKQLSIDIRDEIARLVSSFDAGNAIKNGVPVAIIGAPNVGKSTLLNALLKDEKAIVSDVQGTTRDLIEDTITIQGVLFRFIDTAGLRQTDDKIEKLGIERSLKAVSQAHVILLMTEPGVPWPEIECRDDQTVIKIINKTDSFRAIDGTGVNWLEQELLKSVPTVDNSTVLLTNQRHKQALESAHSSICQALSALEANLPGDLIAEDLRQCLFRLSEILGQVTSSEVLQNIFSKFCIGK